MYKVVLISTIALFLCMFFILKPSPQEQKKIDHAQYYHKKNSYPLSIYDPPYDEKSIRGLIDDVKNDGYAKKFKGDRDFDQFYEFFKIGVRCALAEFLQTLQEREEMYEKIFSKVYHFIGVENANKEELNKVVTLLRTIRECYITSRNVFYIRFFELFKSSKDPNIRQTALSFYNNL